MAKSLNIVKWGEFTITNILGDSINSKAWHSKDLEFSNFDNNIGIPYITRTSLNNGLYGLVVPNPKYILNPANSISLGAENAQYFLQPFRFITGNKMYYYHRDNLSLEALKFIVVCLNKSLNGVGFGFGLGLTGTRSDSRKLMLPITNTGEPDYEFMEEYIKEREAKLKEQYKNHVKARVAELTKEINPAQKWDDFFISDIFTSIQRGKRLTKVKQTIGKIPYVSSTSLNNGVDNFIGNDTGVRIFQDCLSLANSGSVGSCFYEPFKFVASDHVTHLKNNYSKYTYLFLACLLNRLSEKYNFNREINDDRISREKILLPVTPKGEPDYTYMENYMKYLEQKKLLEYLNYIK